jgi:hypothetical protein
MWTMAQAADVYVDEPYLCLRWDSINQHVFTEWKGFANSAEFRASLLKGIEAIKDHHAATYLSDVRKFRVIVHDDQRWVAEHWMPLAVAAGLRRIAFVTAPTGLGKATVEDAASLIHDQGLQSRTFESMIAAKHWLAEIPARP